MESRLKVYSFQEIVAENSKGACWLILDGEFHRCNRKRGLQCYRRQSRVLYAMAAGMVLDVTRWLPQHPGGTKIIPAQALNMDCSRFFEVMPYCCV